MNDEKIVPRTEAGLLKWSFLALSGGVLYYGLEVFYRGYSHWSMALCGALGLCGIYLLNQRLPRLSLPLRALLISLGITLMELVAGGILNLWLGWEIWDYSSLPYSFAGQICLPFSVLWFLLAVPACLLCKLIQRHVFLEDA